MAELTIGAHAYRTGRLDAIEQIHVGRRVAPFYALFGVAMVALSAAPDETKEKAKDETGFLGMFVPILPQLADVFAKMPEEDVNYILHHCLKVCSRVVEGRLAPVIAPGKGLAIMFEDLGMDEVFRLAWAVMDENLQGFSRALRGTLTSRSA